MSAKIFLIAELNIVVDFQENYDRMKVLIDELKGRTEKIKLGEYEHTTDYPQQFLLINVPL